MLFYFCASGGQESRQDACWDAAQLPPLKDYLSLSFWAVVNCFKKVCIIPLTPPSVTPVMQWGVSNRQLSKQGLYLQSFPSTTIP